MPDGGVIGPQDSLHWRIDRVEKDVNVLDTKLDLVLSKLDSGALGQTFAPRRELDLMFQASDQIHKDHEQRLASLEATGRRNTALLIATLLSALGSVALRLLHIGP